MYLKIKTMNVVRIAYGSLKEEPFVINKKKL